LDNPERRPADGRRDDDTVHPDIYVRVQPGRLRAIREPGKRVEVRRGRGRSCVGLVAQNAESRSQIVQRGG